MSQEAAQANVGKELNGAFLRPLRMEKSPGKVGAIVKDRNQLRARLMTFAQDQ
jgi:hypothetical protein